MGNILLALVLLMLLVISGLFSGAETVLFSLSRHDRARMKKSPNRLEALAASLADQPRALLTTLLTGNMTANIMIFVLATVLIARLELGFKETFKSSPYLAAALQVLYVFPPILVTYVSDVFPKVIGSLNNTRIAPLIALPVATLMRIPLACDGADRSGGDAPGAPAGGGSAGPCGIFNG